MSFETILTQQRIDTHTRDGSWTGRTITDDRCALELPARLGITAGSVIHMASTLAHLTGFLYGARLPVQVGATAEFTLAQMRQFLQDKGVAWPYWPERLEVLAELPATASGKIQKFRLREIVREGA